MHLYVEYASHAMNNVHRSGIRSQVRVELPETFTDMPQLHRHRDRNREPLHFAENLVCVPEALLLCVFVQTQELLPDRCASPQPQGEAADVKEDATQRYFDFEFAGSGLCLVQCVQSVQHAHSQQRRLVQLKKSCLVRQCIKDLTENLNGMRSM